MINEEINTDQFKDIPKFHACKVGMRIECLDKFGDPIQPISGVILDITPDFKSVTVQSSYGFGVVTVDKTYYKQIDKINKQEY